MSLLSGAFHGREFGYHPGGPGRQQAAGDQDLTIESTRSVRHQLNKGEQ